MLRSEIIFELQSLARQSDDAALASEAATAAHKPELIVCSGHKMLGACSSPGIAMKKGNPEPLSPELTAALAELEAMADDMIDLSDIPEVIDWSGAKRGLFYKPKNVSE